MATYFTGWDFNRSLERALDRQDKLKANEENNKFRAKELGEKIRAQKALESLRERDLSPCSKEVSFCFSIASLKFCFDFLISLMFKSLVFISFSKKATFSLVSLNSNFRSSASFRALFSWTEHAFLDGVPLLSALSTRSTPFEMLSSD